MSVIRDRTAMLAGMTPMLAPGEFVFCTTQEPALIAQAGPTALGWFKEDEGTTLILARAEAKARGFGDTMPMRRIVLEVFSALDGVGLTAGVAAALAAKNIPCNMIAGYHHDHVFVPAGLAEEALAALVALAARAREGS